MAAAAYARVKEPYALATRRRYEADKDWPRKADRGDCVYCQGPANHWDHVVPKSRGGSNAVTNRQPICNACNASKGRLTGKEYEAELWFAEVKMGKRRGAFNEILPGLYQRGEFLTWPVERKLALMRHLRIGLIVNLWGKIDNQVGDEEIHYLSLPFRSREVGDGEVPLYVKAVVDALRSGRVTLIHCEAGRNRSVFLCAAVVAEMRNCSGEEALAYVIERVPGAKVNARLIKWLYEQYPAPTSEAAVVA